MVDFILNYATDDQTKMIEVGPGVYKEVCENTCIGWIDFEDFVEAFTIVEGGTYIENLTKLSSSGYEFTKPNDEVLEREPALGQVIESMDCTTFLPNSRIADEINTKNTCLFDESML